MNSDRDQREDDEVRQPSNKKRPPRKPTGLTPLRAKKPKAKPSE